MRAADFYIKDAECISVKKIANEHGFSYDQVRALIREEIQYIIDATARPQQWDFFVGYDKQERLIISLNLYNLVSRKMKNYIIDKSSDKTPVCQKKRESTGVLYIIEQIVKGGSIYKVGYSASEYGASMRMAALQTGNPNKLKLIKSFSCPDLSTELQIHRKLRFESKVPQVGGKEWYSVDIDWLIGFIQYELNSIICPA